LLTKKEVKNELTQKKKLFGLKCFLTSHLFIVQFDFENNKKLMMKIEKKIKGEKKMKARKTEKSNKEVKKIIIERERENMIFKFKKSF